MPPATGIVLAGGRSTRFGSDKASALLHGRPLLDWVVSAIAPAVERVVIATAPGQQLPVLRSMRLPLLVVEDDAPALGPLAALASALAAAPRGGPCFAASCDAPLLATSLVRLLLSLALEHEAAAAVPVVDGRRQPLVAVFAADRCLPAFRASLTAGERSVTAALARLSVLEVPEHSLRTADPDLLSFLNINRPEDLASASALLFASGRGPGTRDEGQGTG